MASDEILVANLSRYSNAGVVDDYVNEPYHSIRLKKAISILTTRLPGGAKICDIGPGSAWSPTRLRNEGYPVVALDATYAGTAPPVGCWGVACDFSQALPIASGSIDGILAAEVVEHVFYTRRFLSECFRILRPGGVLSITTPNLAALQDRVGFVRGYSPRHVDPLHEYLYLHIRPFTVSKLRQALAECGFEVGANYGNQIVWRRGEKRYRSRFLARLLPGLAGSIIIGAQKPSGSAQDAR